MKKIQIIEHCDECMHFDTDNYIDGFCEELEREITADPIDGYIYLIPEDCPLEDFKENTAIDKNIMKLKILDNFTLEGSYPGSVYIEQKKQYDNSYKWAVYFHSNCMDRKGNWEMEPMPSNRTEEWLKENRFDSLSEAKNCFCKKYNVNFEVAKDE